MKTLKIDEKTALKIYKTADSELKSILEDSFGKAFFSSKIEDRINSIEDVFDILDEDINDFIIYQNPKTAYQKYINACSLIPKIVEAYNEGTILDFNNSNTSKYLPYFKKVGSGWVCNYCFSWASVTDGPSGHHYKNTTILMDACKKFEHIYNDYCNG